MSDLPPPPPTTPSDGSPDRGSRQFRGNAPDPTGTPVDLPPPRRGSDWLRKRPVLLVGILVIGAVVVLAVLSNDRSSSCPVGRRIEPGQVIQDAFESQNPKLFCFAVGGRGNLYELRVSSRIDTQMALFLDGEELAFSDDAYGLDPAISRVFEPGEYVIKVGFYGYLDVYEYQGTPADFELRVVP